MVRKRIILDEYEKEIEDNIDLLVPVKNLKRERDAILKAAKAHVKNRKSITIRVQKVDLEAMKLKASKLGIPYQTYINMLIHKDALSPKNF